jgi:transcriptional regulator with XRE-family HTH domain
MEMFVNLGRTLGLLRELRGKSQALVAREAGIGKSQLSKYENGKELPKLDSLEKVLRALRVGYFEFFYTLYLVDGRAADLARSDPASPGYAGSPGSPGSPGSDNGPPGNGGGFQRDLFYLPPLLKGHPLIAESTDEAFTKVFSDLLLLYRQVFEQMVFSAAGRSDDLNLSR